MNKILILLLLLLYLLLVIKEQRAIYQCPEFIFFLLWCENFLLSFPVAAFSSWFPVNHATHHHQQHHLPLLFFSSATPQPHHHLRRLNSTASLLRLALWLSCRCFLHHQQRQGAAIQATKDNFFPFSPSESPLLLFFLR